MLECFSWVILTRGGMGHRVLAENEGTIPSIKWLCLHEARHDKRQFLISIRARILSHSLCAKPFPRSCHNLRPWMRKVPNDGNVGITLSPCWMRPFEAMNLAKEISSATPATVNFGTVSVFLTMIVVRFLLFSGGTFQVYV